MKQLLKGLIKRCGINVSLIKNLWYLDSFKIVKLLIEKENPVIFDVGACHGSSIEDFRTIYPSSYIYSFEPFHDSFIGLKKLATGKENVEIFEVALSDLKGEMKFYSNASCATNSLFKAVETNSFIDEHTIAVGEGYVNCITMDEFCETKNILEIDILKIDVQGAELKVLKGAKNLLAKKQIKLIYAEVWFLRSYAEQPLYHSIASYLEDFGYRPHGVYNMHYRKSDGHFLWGDAIFYTH